MSTISPSLAFKEVVSQSQIAEDAGVLDAFEAFVASASARLIRSAYLLSGDRGRAEDLVQMTLVRVAQHWDVARQAPHAYAHRVLVNLLRDRRRWLARRVEETSLSEAGELPDPHGDSATDVVERVAIMAALHALPPRQREVVVLRFFADMSVEDTAAAIGTSDGTVKTHTHRALQALRAALTDDPR